MLSYQHIYHAGNLGDVHKHGLLAWMLDYLTTKEKPLSYMETHAGRALYDLADAAAVKTGEAAQGISRAAHWFSADHPYSRVLQAIRRQHGSTAYPGSPLLSARLLRDCDKIDLAELHPQEHAALDLAMSPYPATCHHRDGFEMAFSLCPPTPRRGVLLIDPSYEVKTDWETIPGQIAKLHRAWNVGVILLWYPILRSGLDRPLRHALRAAHPDAFMHEVGFPPAREGHGMVGSGIFVLNPPYGLEHEARRLGEKFATLK